MSPENQWLVQMYFLLKGCHFLGDMLVFAGVNARFIIQERVVSGMQKKHIPILLGSFRNELIIWGKRNNNEPAWCHGQKLPCFLGHTPKLKMKPEHADISPKKGKLLLSVYPKFQIFKFLFNFKGSIQGTTSANAKKTARQTRLAKAFEAIPSHLNGENSSDLSGENSLARNGVTILIECLLVKEDYKKNWIKSFNCMYLYIYIIYIYYDYMYIYQCQYTSLFI